MLGAILLVFIRLPPLVLMVPAVKVPDTLTACAPTNDVPPVPVESS